MTSSNGNIFRVTGHLCGEFTGPRWIPHTKASDAELLICVWINGWVNNREAGDLRRYRVHYDVILMVWIDCALASPYSDATIKSQFCTSNDSWATVACIKLYPGVKNIRHWKETWFSSKFEWLAHDEFPNALPVLPWCELDNGFIGGIYMEWCFQ